MRDKDVVRLDISMNDGPFVQIVNGTSNFIQDSPYFIDFRYLCGDGLVYLGLNSTLFRHILHDLLPELMA